MSGNAWDHANAILSMVLNDALHKSLTSTSAIILEDNVGDIWKAKFEIICSLIMSIYCPLHDLVHNYIYGHLSAVA